MKKQWFQNGRRIIQNGKRTLAEECPCGCPQCYQPDYLIITVSNAQPPNAEANGIYTVERYTGETLYGASDIPYTFPCNDYTYVLLTSQLMFWLQCQAGDNYIKYKHWDDNWAGGPQVEGRLYKCFRYSFDYAWRFWDGKINVEPVFL